MKTHRLLLGVIVAAGFASTADAADHLLSGTIVSAAGEKLAGVTVSAKAHGTTITTSVYTDEQGNYYFPALPAGKYSVWAQALAFELSKGEVDLTAAKRADLALAPMTDPERRVRQLPGEMLMAALPEATDDDARNKRAFRNLCTGCHTPSYVLQFRFDEDGWNKIIDMMKVVPNSGVYPANPKPNALIDFHQKQLAAYLARARGPGESSLRVTPRPRPSGEAARVVWKLYDLPLEPDAGIGTKYQTNDGTDWSMGTTSKIGLITHDGGMDFDGNLWFTVEQSQSPRHGRQRRRQDRRGQAAQGAAQRRTRRQRPWAGARPAGQFLVRRQSRAAAAWASSIPRPRRSTST